MHPVSVLIITKNEEEMLPICLEHLAWADEVLVVDSYSTDKTVELAKQTGARVLKHVFVDFSDQLNWGIEQTSHEWVLVVDADEIVTRRLRDSIKEVLSTEPKCMVYNVVRDAFFLGRHMKSSTWSNEFVPRLFRKDHFSYSGKVHQKVVTSVKQIGTLKGKLLHYSYRNIDQYFHKMELYSSLWAKERSETRTRVSMAAMYFSVIWRFFHNYFIRGEIRDGMHGIISSGLAASYTYTKYAKLWGYLEEKKTAKAREIRKEEH